MLCHSMPVSWRLWLRRLPAIITHALRRRPRPDLVTLASFCWLTAERRSPLARPTARYDGTTQHGKEINVRRCVDLLSPIVIAPGQVFSWHHRIGPPLRMRGFVPGPELYHGQLARGVGGGSCQVANMVFWLGLHAGLTVVERHRHELDLFPDHERDVPFGCGATVLYPHKDLKLANHTRSDVCIVLRLVDNVLHGSVHTREQPCFRYTLHERNSGFFVQEDTVMRTSTLTRCTLRNDDPVSEEQLFTTTARVAYPVASDALSTLSAIHGVCP